MDLYRVDIDASCLSRLQIPQIFEGNICLVEWANKLQHYNMSHHLYDPTKISLLSVHIQYTNEQLNEEEDEETRLVHLLTECDSWKGRWSDLKEQI